MGMESLTASLRIRRPIEEVFELWGTSEGLRSWFAAGAEVILSAGMYNFWGDHTPEQPVQFSGHTRLIRVDAPRSLCFGWRLRGVETVVDVALAERDGGTQVTVRHESLPARPKDAAALHDFWYAALENLRLRALTGRPQAMLDYGPHVGPVIELHTTVQGPPEAVFDRIANPEQIDRYFGRGARVEPRAGGAISFGWPEGGPRTVTAFEPGRRLAYRWQYEQEPETEVTWALTPSSEGTSLALSHGGWHPHFESEAYRAGWYSFLAIVKGMVELGDDWQMIRIEGAAHGEV
jgi:uncharacterized protein YndB with AHSA1/START domain